MTISVGAVSEQANNAPVCPPLGRVGSLHSIVLFAHPSSQILAEYIVVVVVYAFKLIFCHFIII